MEGHGSACMAEMKFYFSPGLQNNFFQLIVVEFGVIAAVVAVTRKIKSFYGRNSAVMQNRTLVRIYL